MEPFLTEIVCVDDEMHIGKSNELLFHFKKDMKMFSDITTNNIVIMGRKTLESLPNSKPLKNRINLVLSRNTNFDCDGVAGVYNDINSILYSAYKLSKSLNKEAYVIGGGEIYEALFPWSRRLIITHVLNTVVYDADTSFIDKKRIDELFELYRETADPCEGENTIYDVNMKTGFRHAFITKVYNRKIS